ncbi:hypothetical protein HZC09_01670 [Candidatus Micrarchaeota archaeon]|nr:hypothetical protein [Candidatus Micrarchaeota archaeon]
MQEKADIALGHETGELKESLEHVKENPLKFIEAVKRIRELDPKTHEGRQQEKEMLKSYVEEIKELRRKGLCPFSDGDD